MPLPENRSPPLPVIDQTPPLSLQAPSPRAAVQLLLSQLVTAGARSTTPLVMALGHDASAVPSTSTAKPTRLPWVTTPSPQAAGIAFSDASVVSAASVQPGSKNVAPAPSASIWPSPSSSMPLEHCDAAGGAGAPPPDGPPPLGGAGGAGAGAWALTTATGLAGGVLAAGDRSPRSPSSAAPLASSVPPHSRAARTLPSRARSPAAGPPAPRRSGWPSALAAPPQAGAAADVSPAGASAPRIAGAVAPAPSGARPALIARPPALLAAVGRTTATIASRLPPARTTPPVTAPPLGTPPLPAVSLAAPVTGAMATATSPA